jgi:hypothetical protein
MSLLKHDESLFRRAEYFLIVRTASNKKAGKIHDFTSLVPKTHLFFGKNNLQNSFEQ